MKKLFIILLCCLLLSGCRLFEPVPTIAPPITAEPSSAPTEAPLKSFALYYGDDNAEMFLSEEVLVPEINEAVVIEHLIRAGVLTDAVAVNSIQKNGTQLDIDFNQAFAVLVCSMGTSGEYIIVGSTVNTFLNAFHAETMCFTVDGEILESGHVIYDFPLEFTE